MNFILTLILALTPVFSFLCGNLYAAEENLDTIKIEKILQLDIESSINPATYNYLAEGFGAAKKQKADMILVTMNTPGGLVTTTKKILTLFGDSDIPVVVWIKPEGSSATSAGAIIASGAHGLYMSEGTNIGAATPIQMSGDIQQKDMKNKAINDLVALVSSLAETRGRNAKLFGEMIEKASSFKTKEAKEKNLIDGIANTENDLLTQIEGRIFHLKGRDYKSQAPSPEIVPFEMDMGLKLLNIFANPSTAYILFLIGAALIYLELQAPGGFIAGAIGAVSLVLAGIGFQVLPLNFGALGLIILSFALFVMEIYITSYGILSLGGLAALISGSLFLFRTDNAYLELSNSVIFSSVGAIVLFLVFILLVVMRDHKNIGARQFNSQKGKNGEIIEIEEHKIGDYFEYQIKVAGEIWKAKSTTKYNIGDQVTVNDREDLYLIV